MHRGQMCVPKEHSHALQRVPAFLPFNYISALSVAGGKEESGMKGVREWDGGQPAHIPCGSDYLGRERS